MADKSLWDQFTASVSDWSERAGESIEGAVSGAGTFVKSLVGLNTQTVLQAGASLASNQVRSIAGIDTGTNSQQILSKALQQKGIKEYAKASAKVFDPVLVLSEPIEAAWSYAIARPASTAMLMLDRKGNPLYSDGFQLSDFQEAYNRSNVVSFGQAASKSVINAMPFGERMSSFAGAAFGVDFANVNLWDDAEIKKNFEDNIVGKFFSGTLDAGLNIFGSEGINAGAKMLRNVAGLSTEIKGVRDLSKLRAAADEHIAFVDSNGATGSRTNFGSWVELIANSNNLEEVAAAVSRFSNNERLIELATKISDKDIIADMILADKGDLTAMARLMESNPDYLYTIGDMQRSFSARFLERNTQPQGIELENLNAAYDAAIQRNPLYKEVWDAFMDESGNARTLGNSWQPVRNRVVGGAQRKTQTIRMAAKTGDFSGVGAFTVKVLGSKFAGGPVTKLVKFSTSTLPKGFISASNMHATDIIDEIAAVFDDMVMLRDNSRTLTVELRPGTGEKLVDPMEIPVADYRAAVIKKFGSARPNTIKETITVFEEEMKILLSRTYSVSEEAVGDIISKVRQELQESVGQIANNGYIYDAFGERMVYEPAFARQFADVIPMLPWRQIERDVRYISSNALVKGNITAERATNALFNAGQGVFSTNMLVRPAYTLKNSILAPKTDDFMVFGWASMLPEQGLKESMSNFFTNRGRTVARMAIGIRDALPASQAKRLAKSIDEMTVAYKRAIELRDNATSEYIALAAGDLSPTISRERGSQIIDALRRSDELVSEWERRFGVIAPEYMRTHKTVPSIYELWLRVEALKSSPKVLNTSGLEFELRKLIQQNITYAEGTQLQAVEASIARAIDEADALLTKIGVAREQQAQVLIRKLPYKKSKRSYEGDYVFTTSTGHQVTVDDLFAENQFGEAMRAEMSSSAINQLNFTNELYLTHAVSRHSRLMNPGMVTPDDIMYFEQLAYFANRGVRKDKLAEKILEGQTLDELYAWGVSREGRDYLEMFGIEAEDIASFIATRKDRVETYFPTQEVRQRLLDGDVTGPELQQMLAADIKNLYPIHTGDFDTAAAINNMALSNQFSRAKDSFRNFERKMFQLVGTNPENTLVRWPGAGRWFRIQMDRRLSILDEQGVELTPDVVNSVRQAASRETLREIERTYYSIPRQNRMVFTSRILASFPQATVNSLKRYTRFAVNNPGRVGIAIETYRDIYESFGVDSNGNKVPISEATHLVIPFSKNVLNMLGIDAQQDIKISASSLNYTVGNIGASWLVGFSASSLLSLKPEAKEIIEKSFAGEKAYDWIYPLGYVPDKPYETFIAGWQKDLANYIDSDESNQDFLQAWTQAHQTLMAEWDHAGRKGKMPTPEQSQELAKDFFAQRAFSKFFIGFGVNADAPGQIGRDVYYALLEKNKFDQQKTQAEMVERFGDWTKWYTYSTSESRANIPATQESYNRVWGENVDLAKELYNISQQNPDVIGLMVADVEGDFSSPVYNWLKSNPLPGDITTVKRTLTPAQFQERKLVSDGWEDYINTRKQFDDAARSNGMEQLSGEYKALWDFYVSGKDPEGKFKSQLPDFKPLSKRFPEWWKEYNIGSRENTGYKWATALNTIVNNKKFIGKYGKKPFWKAAIKYTVDRELIARAMDSGKYTQSDLQNIWSTYVNSTYGNPDSVSYNEKFYNLYLRYLDNDTLKGF